MHSYIVYGKRKVVNVTHISVKVVSIQIDHVSCNKIRNIDGRFFAAGSFGTYYEHFLNIVPFRSSSQPVRFKTKVTVVRSGHSITFQKLIKIALHRKYFKISICYGAESILCPSKFL